MVLLNVLIRHFISDNMYMPVWMDNLLPMFAACFNGPIYGVLITVLYNIVVMILVPGNFLAQVIVTASMVAVVIIFGTVVRMGFLSDVRGVVGTIAITAFVEAALLTPSNYAFYGGKYAANFFRTWVSDQLLNIHVAAPWNDFLGFFVVALLDKAIIILILIGIMKIIPETVTQKMGLQKGFPTFTIVDTPGDEEFLPESDRLREKAQEKLNKKKAEEQKAEEHNSQDIKREDAVKKEEKKS